MALESVVFQQDPYSNYICKDFVGFGFEEEKIMCEETIQNNNNMYWEYSSCSTTNYSMVQNMKQWDINYSSPEYSPGGGFRAPAEPPASGTGRRKRRRSTKTTKNNEEMENQRMTHITVERNRRRQMNDYLAVLRSLMPPSYAQRVILSLSLYCTKYVYY